MADNNTKEFFIKINGIKESVTNLESLESVLQKMESQVENINKNGGFSVVSKEANKNTKEAIDLAKAEQIAQGEVVSSYKDKQKALSTLGKEIKSMTVADGEAAKKQQEMIQQYNGLNDQLKRFDASMGNHQRNVGDYRGALKEAKDELKNLQGQMVGLDQHSAQFKALATEAGNLKDRINDVNDAIKREASDTKKLDDVINVAQSATAAFQLYKGAMSAFGIETEEAEKAMQKLVGAMNIVQSLQTLSETLQSTSATAQIFQKAMKALGLEFLTTGTNAGTAAASTTAMAAAENTANVATKGLNVGLKATKLALASLGIGLVIMLVTALVEHWEELVGWFTKTFPALKNLSGWFNKVRGTISGLIDAVWAVIKSFGSLGDMMKAIFAGEWGKAVEIAKQNIANITNAYKTGYADKMGEIEEEVTRKKAAEEDKQLTHNKNMITKQKNADGTYRKEYIEANKKMFENRKKMYKKDSDEYRKVLEDEAAFNQQVEDSKTAAAKKGASDRTKVNKEAAKQAAEASKKAAEEEKRTNEARHELSKSILDTQIAELRIQEELEKQRLEAYSKGPLEKYKAQLEKLQKVQEKIKDKENAKAVLDLAKSLEDSVKSIKKSKDAWMDFFNEALSLSKELREKGFNEEEIKKKVQEQISALKLNHADTALVLNSWEKLLQMEDGIVLEYLKKLRDNEKQTAEVLKNIAEKTRKEIEKINAKVRETMVENEPKTYDFYNHLFKSVFDSDKRDKAIQEYKDYWKKVYDETKSQEANLLKTWDTYLENVKAVYTDDSAEYVAAQEEKKKALEEFYNYQKTAEKGTKGKVVSTKGKVRNASEINQNESRTKVNGNTNWSALWDTEAEWYQNTEKLFGLMEDTVLGPAMDTFSMYMDFAIEETQARLEQVQEMHDEALEKVEASVDKIAELNESLKDSSNTNIEATKQQLADEQILYAQRLAEEQKLAQEEKNLQNKANEQQYQSRIMELKYQLVMGIANTALGASKALSQWGWPLGAIFAGVMTALGAVQTALIAKQIGALPKPKKLADGGVLNGPSHAAGGIKLGNLEVEGGEAVINKRSTRQFLPLLDAINAAGNGGKHTLVDKKIRKYANGGQLNFEKVDSNLRQNTDTNRILSAMGNINFQPVVSVVDFENVQNRLVKVRSLAGR